MTDQQREGYMVSVFSGDQRLLSKSIKARNLFEARSMAVSQIPGDVDITRITVNDKEYHSPRTGRPAHRLESAAMTFRLDIEVIRELRRRFAVSRPNAKTSYSLFVNELLRDWLGLE